MVRGARNASTVLGQGSWHTECIGTTHHRQACRTRAEDMLLVLGRRRRVFVVLRCEVLSRHLGAAQSGGYAYMHARTCVTTSGERALKARQIFYKAEKNDECTHHLPSEGSQRSTASHCNRISQRHAATTWPC